MFKVTLKGHIVKWSKIELIWALTCTFMHDSQNNLAQLLFSRSRNAILKRLLNALLDNISVNIKPPSRFILENILPNVNIIN